MTRARFGAAGLAAAAALSALAAGTARAEQAAPGGEAAAWVRVATGPGGLLATFRVLRAAAAALPAADEAALGFCDDAPGGCARPPRFTAANRGTLDLAKAAPGSPNVIYLGARLEAKQRTTLNLLVGARGGLAVRLDGAEVAADESEGFEADRTLARLALSPGTHTLVLRFTRPAAGRWRARVRVLDERFRPGPGPVEIGVGRLEPARARGLAVQAVRVSEVHRLGAARAPEVVLRAWFPGGGVDLPVSVSLAGAAHTLRPADRAVEVVPFPAKARRAAPLTAEIEGKVLKIGQQIARDRPALEAQAALEAALPAAPEASRAPLAWRAAELGRLVRHDDPDQAWRAELVAEARRLAAAIDRGDDPFGAIKGYARMAFFSRLDGTAQPYELFVPPAYRADKRWPLVVTLHGFKGNAGDYFRNTFGLARDAADGESLEGHGRHGEAPTKGPMIVIAPTGRGQAMYRHAGEVDVLEAIDDARRRFNVDPDRIYITGGSMGGTGAAYLPYRNPDLFAASAALAGYHDQRVRADTDHARLSKVERFLLAERSDVDWAENGLHLPTLLVRGTKDAPLEWTRSLARRLKEIGYPFEHREPELGHNVWSETYAEGAIFRHFARFKRPAAPRRVRLRTARERTSRAWWVAIDERAAPDAFADVEARVGDDGLVTVRTGGVTTLTLSPGHELLPADGPVRVEIDGQRLEGPRPLALRRAADGRWEILPPGSPPARPGRKRAGVSGPIRDVFHDPLLFVVGTQDPDHTLVNRLVARVWARPTGWSVSYPIVDDADVTDELLRTHTLVLVGPPRSNLLTRRWADRLPVRYEDGAVVLGGRRYAGPQVGAAFVAPNPDAPDRALLVIAGPSPLGTWRALCLPDILPDYVVFDERIAPARGRWSIGGSGAEALEAGFFGMDWSVP